MMADPFKVAGLGEVLWDLYEQERFAGGAPANFAWHVHLCGASAFILSRVGADEPGAALLKHLRSSGLDISGVQISPVKPTGSVQVRIDDAGQPSFKCSADTAFDDMVCDEIWLSLAPQLDAILFGTLAQREDTSRRAIQRLLKEARDAIKIFDLNLRGWNPSVRAIVEQSLHHSQIIKLNEAELQILSDAYGGDPDQLSFIRALLRDAHIDLAAVTLGSQGCWLITADESVRHQGYRVSVVDTTGCGDAFAAGLIFKYLHKAKLEVMAAYANSIGAVVAMHKGAVPCWSSVDLYKLDGK